MSKFAGLEINTLKAGLKELNNQGIICYTPQKDKPQLTLLQNRMYRDNYKINSVNYLKRKEYFGNRIKAITEYINTSNICRSKLIAVYFSPDPIKSCGICDNCINAKASNTSMDEFEIISGKIFHRIEQSPASMDQLFQFLEGARKEKVWEIVNYLQAERKIGVDKEGFIKKI